MTTVTECNVLRSDLLSSSALLSGLGTRGEKGESATIPSGIASYSALPSPVNLLLGPDEDDALGVSVSTGAE